MKHLNKEIDVTRKFPTQGVECLVENLAQGEAIGRSQVDHLSFAVANSSIRPPHVGEAKMSAHVRSAHVCEDQVEVRVAFVHLPEKVKQL